MLRCGLVKPSLSVGEDFRRDLTGQWFVHISRGCVDGVVADTKNESSTAAVPVACQLGELLMAWSNKKLGSSPENVGKADEADGLAKPVSAEDQARCHCCRIRVEEPSPATPGS